MKRLSFFLAILFTLTILILPVAAQEKGYAPDTTVEITADAVYLLNLETGEVVYEKNADDIIYPASITKLLAAIVALENTQDLDTEIVTYTMNVQNEVYEYVQANGSISHGNLTAGEEMPMRDYLYAMLLPSANEASMAVAEHIGGTQQGFAQMMNDRAKELGATNTNFVNATGLFDEKHVSTARDIAVLAKHALTLPNFKEIVSQYSYTVTTNKHDSLTWESTIKMQDPSNQELYYEYLHGVKTGTVPESGYSFVSTASKDGFQYMLVLIGADITLTEEGRMTQEDNRAFIETRAIYEWAFENLRNKTITEQGTIVGEIPVTLSWDQDFVQVATLEHFTSRIPYNLVTEGEGSDIKKELRVPASLEAPIEKGTQVGELVFFFSDQEIGRVPVVTSSNVEASTLLKILTSLKALAKSFWVKFVVVFLGLLILFYIILLLLRNRNKRRKERRFRK